METGMVFLLLSHITTLLRITTEVVIILACIKYLRS